MLTLMWNLSAAIRGILRFYMPTNIAIDLLRTPRGLKWAVPVALVAVPAYLFAMSICATIVGRGGPGWLNVLVILFFWNAAKFAWLATLSPFFLLAHRLWSARDESSAHRHQSEPGSSSTPCSPRPAVSTPAARSRTPSPSWCSAQPSWSPCAERPAEYTSALADPAQSCELCAEGREFGPGGR